MLKLDIHLGMTLPDLLKYCDAPRKIVMTSSRESKQEGYVEQTSTGTESINVPSDKEST